MDKLISVIIPVYNVKPYLPACMESVRNQSYKNIEIILVDDGSTDGSSELCDFYGKQDNRIIVIHKENGGPASARKEGVNIANGGYITFVDGDDWIDADTYEKLIETGCNADIITYACYEEYGDFCIVKTDAVEKGLYIPNREGNTFYGKMFMNDNFFEFGIMAPVWSKLFKSEILAGNQGAISSSISYGEDAALTYSCLLDAATVCVTNLPFYHYRQRMGSIVKSNQTLPRNNFIDLYGFLKEKFGKASCSRELLSEQLHYYMWFILLVKAYKEIKSGMVLFPFARINKKVRLAIYGAGSFGKVIEDYCKNSADLDIAGWADLHYDAYRKQGLDVVSAEELCDMDFDILVIAILNEKLAEKIKEDFVRKGIPKEKIDWVKKNVLKEIQLPDWVVAS